MNKKMNKNNKGFSLVELIIVIAIMVILAGVLIPQFARYMNNSRVSADIDQAQNIYNALAAEYSEEAADGAFVDVQPDGATHDVDAALTTVLGMGSTAPTSKVASGTGFSYTIDDTTGNIAIYIGSDQIVPEVTAGSKWD